VLIVRDQVAGAEHIDRLRLSAVPVWSASTGFELLWLLEHMAARPSVALVDLRPLTHDRPDRVADLASLAAASRLPTVVIGADAGELESFRNVIAAVPVDAATDQVIAAIHAHL
jgi:hypothetical protein